MFYTDSRCSMPFHTLVTDAVESQGDSTVLIKTLNRLCVCPSSDTPARFVQYKESTRGTDDHATDITPFPLSSMDNLDFLHGDAQIHHGKQTGSWHGTNVQIVHPLPSLETIEPPSSPSLSHPDLQPTALSQPDTQSTIQPTALSQSDTI